MPHGRQVGQVENPPNESFFSGGLESGFEHGQSSP
jgi:hypothetical protein